MGRAMAKAPDKRRAAIPDAHLWRVVADETRPLKHKRRPVPSAADFAPDEIPANDKPAAKAKTKPKLKSAVLPRPLPRPVAPALEAGPGAPPNVDRNTALRFKKGDMPIEATLDLHGMTQESAHIALAAFIARARAAGRRCLLVITGKGRRAGSGGESTGVLRANVPRWLNGADLRPHVLAITHARPRHGGEGALYVLLKRVRGAP